MEGENTTKRSHWLHLRLTVEEHAKLIRKYNATPYRKLSDYARVKLFEKPLTVLARDASLDDALAELALIREELRAIGVNLNQVAHQVNANRNIATGDNWRVSFVTMRSALMLKLEELGLQLTKISTAWLQ